MMASWMGCILISPAVVTLLVLLTSSHIDIAHTAPPSDEAAASASDATPASTTDGDPVLTTATTVDAPTVFVSILARNVEHILPYFLGHLENLNYPKQKITLWFASDHNSDYTIRIIREWNFHLAKHYQDVILNLDDKAEDYTDETQADIWSKEHLLTVITHRQNALDAARKAGTDYILLLDADCILTHPDVLQHMMSHRGSMVAPLLEVPDQLYSNFWTDMTDTGYYKRGDNYMEILERKEIGCFEVPMVHSTVLIDLRHPNTRDLIYLPAFPDYTGPTDDIIIFAASARKFGVPMHVCNHERYGLVVPPVTSLPEHIQFTIYYNLLSISQATPLIYSDHVTRMEELDYGGFDMIYLINLERRTERFEKMTKMLEVLGLSFLHIPGYDGQHMNRSYLDSIQVKMLPTYEDPYHKRPLKYGEIGCFLSHYVVWRDVIDKGYRRVLVFEDDVKFGYNFRPSLTDLLTAADSSVPNWDLIYLGRKKIDGRQETYIEGSNKKLVWPLYSYWTVSYALSQTGAAKLVDQNPLPKMVAVDEYLPIMYNQHPNEEWKSHFEPRDLVALSSHPVLLEPAFYTGESSYETDTEDSLIYEAGGSSLYSRSLRGETNDPTYIQISAVDLAHSLTDNFLRIRAGQTHYRERPLQDEL